MKQTRRCFKYLRLSSEDEAVSERMRDESNSIASQRTLLNHYILTHPDIGSNFEEIVDDGFSGTSFHRPGMTRLLNLVEADQVETIIVKDLSRFGRNYLEAGYYIELVLPSHRTRLIAVNDCYDSNERNYSAGDIDLALNNLKNEYYSRDNSEKVKSSLDAQRRSGQFSGRVPYGYVKGPTKREILIDEEAAQVVRYIFHLAADRNMKNSEIAQQLNSEGIPSPSLYRKQKWGYKGKVQSLWTISSVFHILTNRIFTGSYEMYKRHLNCVGSKLMTVVPKEERVIIHNTHEAIVSEEVFFEAQKVMNPYGKGPVRNNSYVPPPMPMLASYLKCGHCGIKLRRAVSTDTVFICRTASVHAESPCEKVICDARALEEVVYKAICNMAELVNEANRQQQREREFLLNQIGSTKNQIRSMSQKRKEIVIKKMALYEQFKTGTLDKSGFAARKREADQHIKGIMEKMELLTQRLADVSRQLDDMDAKPQSTAPALSDTDRLTPALLEAFISKVIVREGGETEIVFRTQDVFQEKHT